MSTCSHEPKKRPLEESYSITGNAPPDSLSVCQLFKDYSSLRSELSQHLTVPYHRNTSVNVFPYFWILCKVFICQLKQTFHCTSAY